MTRIALAVFFVCTLGGCVKQTRNDSEVLIRSGTKVEYGSFIDTVTTPVRGESKGTGVWIHKKIVLTAGHVANSRGSASVAWNDGSSIVGASSIVTHPDFQIIGNGDSSENDLSILFLDEEAKIQNPAKIATKKASIEAGSILTVAGYGALSLNGSGQNKLLSVDMKIVKWHDDREIRTEHPDGVGGACPGDSGGPGFAKENGELKLAGISTHGDCDQGVLSSANLQTYMPWIQKVLRSRGYEVDKESGSIVQIGTPAQPENPNEEPNSPPVKNDPEVPAVLPGQAHKCLSTGYTFESLVDCKTKCPHQMCFPK